MASPNDRIAAGLENRQHNATSNTTSLGSLKGAPTSPQGLSECLSAAEAARTRLVTIVSDTNAKTREGKTAIADKFAEIGISRQPGNTPGTTIRTDDIGPDRRRAMIAAEASKLEKKLKADAEAGVLKEYKAVSEILERVGRTREALADPVRWLMSSTRVNGERAHYAAVLANSGSAEIRAAVDDAIAGGDRNLAAACLSRIDAMDQKTREATGVNRRELAAALSSPEHRKVSEMLAALDLISADCDVALAEHSGRTAQLSQLMARRGLAQRKLEAILSGGEPETAETEEDAS